MRYLILVLLFATTQAHAVVIVRNPPPVGSASPTIVSSEKCQSTSGNDIVCSLPTGSGGNLYLILSGRNAEHTGADPAGFTAFLSEATTSNNNWITIFERVSDGSEAASLTVTLTSGNDKVGFYMRVSDTTGKDVSGLKGEGVNLTAFTAPSITTVATDSLAFVVGGLKDGRANPWSITSGTGWTVYDDHFSDSSNNGTSIFIATKPMPAAGATGDVSLQTSIADSGVTVQFSLKP